MALLSWNTWKKSINRCLVVLEWSWSLSGTTLVLKHFHHHHWHLRKRQRPEAENPEEENVESPEKDDQRVEVVVEAGEDKGLDCFAYMEGCSNGTENIKDWWSFEDLD